MKELFAGLKRWYQRRFRGVVAPPRQYGGTGTTWHQHPRNVDLVFCLCGELIEFTQQDYIIREREHRPECTQMSRDQAALSQSVLKDSEKANRMRVEMLADCGCPVTDARYVKICPNCRRGHWKDASAKP